MEVAASRADKVGTIAFAIFLSLLHRHLPMQSLYTRSTNVFREQRPTVGQCWDFTEATVGEEDNFSLFTPRIHQSVPRFT